MTVTLDKSHELKGNGYLLGVGGENESEQLVINVAYDLLLDKWAYIEFEQNGKKNTTERLTIVNGQIVYTLTNSVLVQGLVDVQVVFRDASGFVWKSHKRRFAVSEEINATESMAEQHPDFITEAQRLLDGIADNSGKIDAFLSSDAEKARVAAEEQRQINEAGRVAAETARRTEFSGWANSLGNLNTYDKRLINLEEAGVGTLFDYVTDDTTAYSKTVPAKALPYARLNKVGGMTYKANNALTDTIVKSVGGYAIPEAVQALDGYGKGIDENCYNCIDFERKKFIKKVGTLVITGEENFYIQTFGSGITGIGIQASIGSKPSNTYINSCGYRNLKDYSVQNNLIITATAVYIVDINYQTIDTMRERIRNLYANGTPLTITYKLDEIVETDISAYITDNYIKVNGSVVFENDNGQAVPSEIIYAVKK